MFCGKRWRGRFENDVLNALLLRPSLRLTQLASFGSFKPPLSSRLVSNAEMKAAAQKKHCTNVNFKSKPAVYALTWLDLSPLAPIARHQLRDWLI